MTLSSGSIVGGSGNPHLKCQLVQNESTVFWNFIMCLYREVNIQIGYEGYYEYTILLPKNIGCDISTREMTTSPSQQPILMGLLPNGTWERIPPGEAYQYIGEIGCFNKFNLRVVISAVLDDKTYCDLIVCLNGRLPLSPCKSITGCEKFCVYITATSEVIVPI